MHDFIIIFVKKSKYIFVGHIEELYCLCGRA